MEGTDKTRTLLIVAIALAVLGIFVGAFGLVKANDAKQAAADNSGQQTELSASFDQRLTELESRGRKEIQRAEKQLTVKERAAVRSSARALKATDKKIAALESQITALNKKTVTINGRISQGNVATEARLQELESEIRRIQKQIKNLLP